jgi:hypothetical protein
VHWLHVTVLNYEHNSDFQKDIAVERLGLWSGKYVRVLPKWKLGVCWIIQTLFTKCVYIEYILLALTDDTSMMNTLFVQESIKSVTVLLLCKL